MLPAARAISANATALAWTSNVGRTPVLRGIADQWSTQNSRACSGLTRPAQPHADGKIDTSLGDVEVARRQTGYVDLFGSPEIDHAEGVGDDVSIVGRRHQLEKHHLGQIDIADSASDEIPGQDRRVQCAEA